MSTEITPYKQKMDSVRGLLERQKAQIALALPKHITADRITRVVLTSIARTPKLLECDKMSLLGAIMESCQLGLEPDGVLGHAYLIPYGNKVQFIPGYRGLVDLARRSGRLTNIYAEVVHAKDLFKVTKGLRRDLIHEESLDDERGELVAVYAVAFLKDTDIPEFVVMRKADVEKIRKRSRAANNGPWITDTEEMWKKTAIRRLCKMLPTSAEFQKAVSLETQADLGKPQDLITLGPEEVQDITPGDGNGNGNEPSGALDRLVDQNRARADGKEVRRRTSWTGAPANTKTAGITGPTLLSIREYLPGQQTLVDQFVAARNLSQPALESLREDEGQQLLGMLQSTEQPAEQAEQRHEIDCPDRGMVPVDRCTGCLSRHGCPAWEG